MAWAQGGARLRGESPRVLGQGARLGRADGPYIGVYNTNAYVGGQFIAAATVARSAPPYGLALRAAYAAVENSQSWIRRLRIENFQ